MIKVNEQVGRTTELHGEPYLFFSGYSYLGMHLVPEFLALVEAGQRKYGWLFPSSRISNTQLALYEECETLLSEITGTEATVLLPSGFSAGRAATGIFPENQLQNAPGSHPAISRTQPATNDFTAWSRTLVEQVNAGEGEVPAVFASDSVSPLTTTTYNFSFLAELQKPAVAIIDDSHGIGILGENGRGVRSTLPRQPNVQYLITYSLSKAFGIAGGAVSGPKGLAEQCRAVPEYTAVTPLSPALVYAFLNGQAIYAQQRERLSQNLRYFEAAIGGLPGIRYNPDFPVFILPPALDEEVFYRQRMLISSFAYPDPTGPKLNRIVLNALHTKEDLDTLTEFLHAVHAADESLFQVRQLNGLVGG